VISLAAEQRQISKKNPIKEQQSFGEAKQSYSNQSNKCAAPLELRYTLRNCDVTNVSPRCGFPAILWLK